MHCELCAQTGGQLVWQNERVRVVLVDDADYPGFCRVILQRHAAEMTDLDAAEVQSIFTVVLAVERVLRAVLQPDKINLASLGNMTPHVHWHVIPRYRDDAHFPQPVWGQRQRATPPRELDRDTLLQALEAALSGVAA